MIRNKRIWCRVGGTNYGYYLHTNKITTPSICVRTGNETLYCPLTTGSSKLHVRYNGTNYGAQSYTPILQYQLMLSYNTGSYGYNTTMGIRNITMLNSCSISKQIQIKMQTVGNTSVFTMATLNAGATSASNNSVNSFSPGASTPSMKVTITVGGTQIYSGTVSPTSWSTRQVNIPSTYW